MPGTGVWALNPQEEQNKQWKDQRARSPLVRLGEMAKPPVVRLREISELSPSSPQLFPDDNTGLPSFALDDGANWLMQVVQDDSDEDNSDDNPDHCTLPPQDASNWSALVKGGEEGASGTVNRGKHRGGSQGENRRGSLPTEDRKGSGPMLQGTRQQMFRGSIVAETVEGDESLFHLLTRRNRKVGMEGTRVLCKYKEDSKTWKSAQIVSVRAEDSVHVKFDGYEDVVELPPNHVRIIPADYDNQSDTPAPPAKSQTIGKQSGPAAKPLGKPAKSKRKRNSAPSTKGPTGPS